MAFIFHFIYKMSSFPLTFIFFKMVIAQPTRFIIHPKWGINMISLVEQTQEMCAEIAAADAE